MLWFSKWQQKWFSDFEVWLFKSGKKWFHPLLVQYKSEMNSSRKYPHPHHRRSLGILRGWGSQKLKNVKETMKLNCNYRGMRGFSSQKTSSGEGMDSLWNNTICEWCDTEWNFYCFTQDKCKSKMSRKIFLWCCLASWGVNLLTADLRNFKSRHLLGETQGWPHSVKNCFLGPKRVPLLGPKGKR